MGDRWAVMLSFILCLALLAGEGYTKPFTFLTGPGTKTDNGLNNPLGAQRNHRPKLVPRTDNSGMIPVQTRPIDEADPGEPSMELENARGDQYVPENAYENTPYGVHSPTHDDVQGVRENPNENTSDGVHDHTYEIVQDARDDPYEALPGELEDQSKSLHGDPEQEHQHDVPEERHNDEEIRPQLPERNKNTQQLKEEVEQARQTADAMVKKIEKARHQQDIDDAMKTAKTAVTAATKATRTIADLIEFRSTRVIDTQNDRKEFESASESLAQARELAAQVEGSGLLQAIAFSVSDARSTAEVAKNAKGIEFAELVKKVKETAAHTDNIVKDLMGRVKAKVDLAKKKEAMRTGSQAGSAKELGLLPDLVRESESDALIRELKLVNQEISPLRRALKQSDEMVESVNTSVSQVTERIAEVRRRDTVDQIEQMRVGKTTSGTRTPWWANLLLSIASAITSLAGTKILSTAAGVAGSAGLATGATQAGWLGSGLLTQEEERLLANKDAMSIVQADVEELVGRIIEETVLRAREDLPVVTGPVGDEAAAAAAAAAEPALLARSVATQAEASQRVARALKEIMVTAPADCIRDAVSTARWDMLGM